MVHINGGLVSVRMFVSGLELQLEIPLDAALRRAARMGRFQKGGITVWSRGDFALVDFGLHAVEINHRPMEPGMLVIERNGSSYRFYRASGTAA